MHGFAQACSVLCDGAHQERSYYVPSSRIHVAETKHPSGAQRAALLLAEASTALSPGWSMWARDRPGIRCALHVVDGAPLVVPKMSARNGAAGGGRQVAKLRSIRPDRSRPLTTVRPGTAGSAPRFRNLQVPTLNDFLSVRSKTLVSTHVREAKILCPTSPKSVRTPLKLRHSPNQSNPSTRPRSRAE